MIDEPKTPAKKSEQDTIWLAFGLVFELGYLIAIPAFLFGFGGAWLDKHFGSSPIFVILGLIVALLISSFVVYRRVKSITSRL